MGGDRKRLVPLLGLVVALAAASPASAYVPGDLTGIGCVSESSALASETVEGCGTLDGHGLLGADAIALSPDGTSAYVTSGSGFSGQILSNALATFERNPVTGALTETGCVGETTTECEIDTDGLTGVSDVKVSPDGTRVYVASSTSGVTVFDRAADGALTPAGCFKDPGETTGDFSCTPEPGFEFGGARSLVVSADSQYVYATTQNGNAIVEFKRSGSSLAYLGCISGDSGANTSCAVKTDIGLVGINGLAIDPSGDRLYAVSYAGNALDVFSLSPTTGLITGEVGCDSLASGGGEGLCTDTVVTGLSSAQNVAVSANGANVYVTSLDGAVASFATTSGAPGVSPIGCIGAASPAPPTPGCTNAGIGLRGASDIVLAPNPAPGTVAAYVTGLFDNAVAELSIDPSTGALVPLPAPNGCVTAGVKDDTCPGPDAAGLNGAQGLAISPDGKDLYVSSRGQGATHHGCGSTCTDTVAAVTSFSRFAAPAVVTTAATAVGVSSAELHGTVNPEGAPTTYQFQLSTSPSFTGAVSLPAASAGSGASGVTLGAAADGLKAATTYYYRLVASNSGGSSTSTPAERFTTEAATASTTVTVGDQRLTVTAPSTAVCVAGSTKLSVRVAVARLRSKHTHASFKEASLYIDKGVKHARRRHKPTYAANATVRHLPATVRLSLRGVKRGRHTLKVVASFTEASGKHKHKTATKTLRTKFVVC